VNRIVILEQKKNISTVFQNALTLNFRMSASIRTRANIHGPQPDSQVQQFARVPRSGNKFYKCLSEEPLTLKNTVYISSSYEIQYELNHLQILIITNSLQK